MTPSPIDWGLAAKVAQRVAKRAPQRSPDLQRSLDDDFAAVTCEAETLVADHTGLRAPSPARASVVDRAAWIDANIVSMRRLLAPLTDRIGERLAASRIAPVGRRAAGAEVGVLLGYMSQRVLGQYDLLVPDEPGSEHDRDAVYYVGPNIAALEARYAFPPLDFRRWIALHELTHRAQFTGVPWLKGYFLSLVEESLSLVDPDPQRLTRAVGRAVEELRAGRNPFDDGGLVALLAPPEQRAVLDRVQALMSVLEGHGNAVMNALGREHVAGQDRMARVLSARRNARGLTSFFHKLLGLESKMRQYEVGENFIAAIEREGGPRTVDVIWRGPEMLPSADELVDPHAWLARVGSLTAA